MYYYYLLIFTVETADAWLLLVIFAYDYLPQNRERRFDVFTHDKLQ